MNRHARGVALGAAILAGCLPELERHEGEHILFEHSASLEVCAGTIDYLDHMIPFLSEQLGISTPEKIRYSWLTPADSERLFGSLEPDSGGVAIGRHATSFLDPVMVHEIVHALMHPRGSAPFFQEGLAVAYDVLAYGQSFYELQGLWPDPRPLMTRDALELDYAYAGVFVYFLIARHGPERFVEFYASLQAPYTLAQIGAAFRRVYGFELDVEVERFMSGVRSCDEDYFEILAARCSAPVQPWRGEVWTFADVLACDASGVIGGSTQGWNVPEYRITTIEIPRAGDYEITASFDGDLFGYIAACFGCPWRPAGAGLPPGTWRLPLEAGRYHVHVEGDADLEARFSVVVRAVEGGEGS